MVSTKKRGQEHEEALLEECDAQLEAAATPAATGEDGTEQEFLEGKDFCFPVAWVERWT